MMSMSFSISLSCCARVLLKRSVKWIIERWCACRSNRQERFRKACTSGEPDVLRHAQRVVVCLALVPRLRDLLDSPESDRNVVAIVPANCDYRRAREPAWNMQTSAISDNALDRTVALFFKVKSGIQGELLHRTRHIKKSHGMQFQKQSTNLARCFPERFRPARLARIVPI
jgi:hypothetical protein